MPNATIGKLPFWPVSYDAKGQAKSGAEITALIKGAKAAQLTDLFVFSHGWNNDATTARRLYDGFFGEVSTLLDKRKAALKPGAKIGTAGILWPSILWPDDGGGSAGGSASAGAKRGPSNAELTKALSQAFATPKQRALVQRLMKLLAERKKSDAALLEFRDKLGALLSEAERAGGAKTKAPAAAAKKGKKGSAAAASVGGTKATKSEPDAIEREVTELNDAEWRALLDRMGDGERAASGSTGGGAAGLGDVFEKLWNGAKSVLRTATYYEMKRRAGVVGQCGLGSLLVRVNAALPALRVHLLGHSFGARVVSFALAGLPATAVGGKSPVKSLFLLQGALSHFTFADKLPFDGSRGGALKGLARRVDGPLLTTHSKKDLAVGVAYPAASFIARQDASAAGESDFRWGAMGSDGAQAVAAAAAPLGAPGVSYKLPAGKWLNLDGNKVIIHGGPPSGAHSDIVHPHTAWAALAAASLVKS